MNLHEMKTGEQVLRPDKIIGDVYYHYSFAQNTPEWDEIRKGIITASPAKCLLVSSETKAGKATAGSVGTLAKGAVTYATKIARSRYSPNSGSSDDRYYNADMERGHKEELDACLLFEDITGFTTDQVGFISRKEGVNTIGCSPDRLITNSNGDKVICGLEMKSAKADIHFDRMMDQTEFIKEHFAQVQFQMFITGLNAWYLTSYNPSFDIKEDRLVICDIKRCEDTMDIFRSQVDAMEMYISDVIFSLMNRNNKTVAA